jgi:hypothetical protein
MKINKHFYFALVFILLCSCSTTQRTTKPPLVSHGLSLARTVIEKDGIGEPQGVTSAFSCEDKEVLAFLRFDNLAGPHQLRWNWYAPDGSLYCSSGGYTPQTGATSFYRVVTAWHALTIRGDKAARLQGKWHVDVFINGDLLDRKSFTLNP